MNKNDVVKLEDSFVRILDTKDDKYLVIDCRLMTFIYPPLNLFSGGKALNFKFNYCGLKAKEEVTTL